MNLRYDGILILNVIKSVNFDVIRKLIRYSLKNLRLKLMLAVTVFKMLLFDCRLVLAPAKRDTGSERVNTLHILVTWFSTSEELLYLSILQRDQQLEVVK